MSEQRELSTLNQIALKVASLETMQGELVRNLNRLIEKLDVSDDVAKKALEGVKSAQHQINEIKDELKGIRSSIKWMIGTAISGFGLAISVIGIILGLMS